MCVLFVVHDDITRLAFDTRLSQSEQHQPTTPRAPPPSDYAPEKLCLLRKLKPYPRECHSLSNILQTLGTGLVIGFGLASHRHVSLPCIVRVLVLLLFMPLVLEFVCA